MLRIYSPSSMAQASWRGIHIPNPNSSEDFRGPDDEDAKDAHESSGLLESREGSQENSGFSSIKPICGTINRSEQMRMKKLIFRASRGNAYIQFYDFKEKVFDYSGKELNTTVFFVLFPQNFAYLKNKLVSVCDSFMGEKYSVPDKMSEIKEKLKRVNSNIVNIFNTLHFTIENFKKFLISSHESDILEDFSLLRVY
jgi:V-type ATPase 116kDa subunit family